MSPALALHLPSCAWSSSRNTGDFAFRPHLCGEDETHLPPRDPTPEVKGGGTPGEAPSLWDQPPRPCSLCFPHRRSRVRRCPTQLSSKSFICARLAPQCPGQGWEAGAKSHSTLSWGPPPVPESQHLPAGPGSQHLPPLPQLIPFHSRGVGRGHGQASPPSAACHTDPTSPWTPCPGLYPLCQRQLESRSSWKHRAND